MDDEPNLRQLIPLPPAAVIVVVVRSGVGLYKEAVSSTFIAQSSCKAA